MLQRIRKAKTRKAVGGHFAIIASEYNPRYVDAMLTAAQARLRAAGAKSVKVVRVPGAFEIPVVAARLAASRTSPPDAIICLGVILRGKTTHAPHIGEAISQALARIQIQSGIPIIHEVLLLENHQQAAVRCLGRDHNRGAEAAETALAMKKVMQALED